MLRGNTSSKQMTIILFILFVLGSLIQLDKLLDEAKQRDQELNGKAIQFDDWEYQTLAVNLLHGQGYTKRFTLDYDTYNVYYEPHSFQNMATLAEVFGHSPEDDSDHKNIDFYRTPGFPMMLALNYVIFGEKTINGRYMMAILKWLTAILLLILGIYAIRPYGILIGGAASAYFLYFYPMIPVERLMTEIPTTFWTVLLALVLVIYLDTQKIRDLILVGLTLTCLAYVRPPFLLLVPLLLLYLWLAKIAWRHLIILTIIVAIPMAAWSIYASLTVGQPVFMTTQGNEEFPRWNNVDVLEGQGPDRVGQGSFLLSVAQKYTTQPGENGWLKGLKFWWDHLDQLPRLFFVKLRAGSWYVSGERGLGIEGLQLSGIGLLLLALGLREPRYPLRFLQGFRSEEILRIQIVLVALLFLMSNYVHFLIILLTYAVITMIAVIRPYGDAYTLPFRPPVWFLPFIASHTVSTMMYFGLARYRFPFDGILLLLTLAGILTITLELFKRHVWLGWMFLGLVLAAVLNKESNLIIYFIGIGAIFAVMLLIPLIQEERTRPRLIFMGAIGAVIVLQLWGASFREPAIRTAYYPILFRLFPHQNILRNWGFNETDYAAYSQVFHSDGKVLNIQTNFLVPDRDNVVLPDELPAGVYDKWLANPLPGYLKQAGVDYIFIHQAWWDNLGERQRNLITDPQYYTQISLLYNTHTEFYYGFYRLENSDIPPEPVYSSGELSVFLEANNTYALYRIENGQGIYLIHLDPANLPQEAILVPDGWTIELVPLEDGRIQVKLFDPNGKLHDDGFVLDSP